MFNLGNLRLPTGIDRVLRWFVFTPDMRRVHHSDVSFETNSNFGFNLPWWGLLFGTYRAQPGLGHENMTIGLHAFRDGAEFHFSYMLVQPFRRGAGELRWPLKIGQVVKVYSSVRRRKWDGRLSPPDAGGLNLNRNTP